MASSACRQDDPNRALWLATREGKMEPSCPLGTTRFIPQEKLPRKPYNKSFMIDQVCSVKMAGYWPRSFFASVWTSTSSRSINTQKKNLANIQPSWPNTWSITHTTWPLAIARREKMISSSDLDHEKLLWEKRFSNPISKPQCHSEVFYVHAILAPEQALRLPPLPPPPSTPLRSPKRAWARQDWILGY